MAVVDPYSPCPCGSGQKFKWCCHKVEAYAERAQRLFDGGQNEASLQTLDEGLRKEPGNAWLLSRKALLSTRLGKVDEAKDAVRLILKSNPKHAGALVLLVRLTVESEGASAGVAQLQHVLSTVPANSRAGLASLVRIVGIFLIEEHKIPAALRHLFLALRLGGDQTDDSLSATNVIPMIYGNPSIPTWFKNHEEILPPPPALGGESRRRFDDAVGWAGEGLWSSAAAAFETLAADPVAGAPAERNAGFCRLWLADMDAAVGALRRYVDRIGATEEAVDVEALCQQLDDPRYEPRVEKVRLTWPVRDREALLKAFRADPTVAEEEPDDEEDEPQEGEKAPYEGESFVLLDRPEIARGGEVADGGKGLTPGQIPVVVGRVSVGSGQLALETFDDGRLDGLVDRVTAVAGRGIPPAHPKTTSVERVSRLQLAMAWEWQVPEGTDVAQSLRLYREERARVILEEWPNIPMGALGRRTPLDAAAAGDSEVPLRALALSLVSSREPFYDRATDEALRTRLGIPLEPAVDPIAFDPDTIPLARTAFVPVAEVPDEALVALFNRVRSAVFRPTVDATSRELAGRPSARALMHDRGISVFADLANMAVQEGDPDGGAEWLRKGREADPAPLRAANAPQWDMIELGLRLRSEPPSQWVPDLAMILDRYRGNTEATQTVVYHLMNLGLLEAVPDKERPGEVLLDSRILQALLSEFGPRVTTASGRLGVSATKPEIWTPGSEGPAGGGSSGLWTPGSGAGAAPPADGGKRLIIPGR